MLYTNRYTSAGSRSEENTMCVCVCVDWERHRKRGGRDTDWQRVRVRETEENGTQYMQAVSLIAASHNVFWLKTSKHLCSVEAHTQPPPTHTWFDSSWHRTLVVACGIVSVNVDLQTDTINRIFRYTYPCIGAQSCVYRTYTQKCNAFFLYYVSKC